MKSFFFGMLGFFFAAPLLAQQQDTVSLPTKVQNALLYSDTIANKLSIDTLSAKAKKKLPRLNSKKQKAQKKINNLNPNNKVADFSNQANQKLDSLSAQNKLKQAVSKAEHFTDSLNPQKQLAHYQHKADSVQGRISAKIDSLQNFKLPDIRLAKSIDSLKQKIDSLKNKGLLKDINKAEKKLADLQSKATSKVSSLQKGVNEKLDMFNKEGGKVGNVTLPDVNGKIPTIDSGINVPNLNTKLPSINGLPNLKDKLGNVGLPSLKGKLSMPNNQTANTNTGIKNLGLPSLNLKDNGLGDIGKELSNVTNSTKEISKYQEGLKSISKDGLNDEKLKKEMEANAANMAGGKVLETKLSEVEKQKALVEKWNSDPEYRKEMAVNQAKEQATNHFAGKEKELMAAMDQLSKAKTKIKDAEQVVDMFKKPTNPMKGKPFIERLRPSINLQVQSRQNVMVDFNPQIGYRISGRFMAGAGWNERISFNSKRSSVNFDDRVYGPRSYVQAKIKGGSYGLLNAECMNAEFVPSNGEGSRQWVWSYMAGYKQEFRISNKLLGNVQIMYTMYTSYYKSPYVDKLNIRIGFEFPQRKKHAKRN